MFVFILFLTYKPVCLSAFLSFSFSFSVPRRSAVRTAVGSWTIVGTSPLEVSEHFRPAGNEHAYQAEQDECGTTHRKIEFSWINQMIIHQKLGPENVFLLSECKEEMEIEWMTGGEIFGNTHPPTLGAWLDGKN